MGQGAEYMILRGVRPGTQGQFLPDCELGWGAQLILSADRGCDLSLDCSNRQYLERIDDLHDLARCEDDCESVHITTGSFVSGTVAWS